MCLQRQPWKKGGTGQATAHPSIHPSTARVVKHSRGQTNSLALSALRDRCTARREVGRKEDTGIIGGDLHLRGQPWLARDSDPCYRVRCP